MTPVHAPSVAPHHLSTAAKLLSFTLWPHCVLLPIWTWKMAWLFHLHFFDYYGWTFFSHIYQLSITSDLPISHFVHFYIEHSYFLTDLERLFIVLILCHLYATNIFFKGVDWLLLLFMVFTGWKLFKNRDHLFYFFPIASIQQSTA